MSDFLDDFTVINPSRPWLEPYLPIHKAFEINRKTPLADWLNTYFNQANLQPASHTGQRLYFTHQSDLPHGVAYERFIGSTNKIPTRDNLHDWFGACVWSVFPKTKALLNAKHLEQSVDGTTNNRNRVQDTITVFDENGAIFVVSDDTLGSDIADALINFDWQACLVKSRLHWHNPTNPKHSDHAQVFVFGHALLEQLVTPRKSLCAHAVILRVAPTFFGLCLDAKLAFIDDALCHHMDKLLQNEATPRRLHPLPILGVPYFWENDDAAFYDDPFVFRKGRGSHLAKHSTTIDLPT